MHPLDIEPGRTYTDGHGNVRRVLHLEQKQWRRNSTTTVEWTEVCYDEISETRFPLTDIIPITQFAAWAVGDSPKYMAAVAALFDERGNCPTLGDPYRERETETFHLLFDDDGDLYHEVWKYLLELVRTQPVDPLCDAVKLVVAHAFAMNTSGNYSTVTLWRGDALT